MAEVNKVETADGKVVIDLTSDTVAADKLQKGVTAHSASGETVEGILEKVQYMTQEEFDAAEAAGTLDPDGYYGTPDDEQTTTATAGKVGVMKLYEALGNATDGTMTQAAIKAAVETGGGGMQMVSGSYIGDGTVGRIIETGFAPDFITVCRSDTSDYRFVASKETHATAGTAGEVLASAENGFILGAGGSTAANNTNRSTYPYVFAAFKGVS